ncbi:MAG: LamG-like jellyroll fold domain-containing protein [Verrucomicrobiota bacterium]
MGVGVEGPSGRFKPDVVAPGSFVVSTSSGFNDEWDTNAYFNPTNISTIAFDGQTVTTNGLNNYAAVSVPPNAVGVTIVITPDQDPPFATNLLIYAQESGPPSLSDPGAIDIITSNNMLAIPPGGGTISLTSIQNGGFDFAIGDSLNVPVNYNVTVFIATTNTDGNEEQVLEGLDNGLAPFYRFESGTSMSAPAVSGTLALIQDYFTNQLHETPSPALLKAMLINGSRSIGNYTYAFTNGNNFQGWGLPNIQNSVPLTTANLTSPTNGGSTPMFFVDQSISNALATGQSHTYFVNIDTNASDFAQDLDLQATVVWTDPPGDPSAAIKLVNGLELIMTNLDTGEVFYGNDIAPENSFNLPWNTNLPPNIDTINNVENILLRPSVSEPTTSQLGSRYSVTVLGRQVNVNAVTEQTNNVVQDYALVVSVGDMGEVSNAITSVTDEGVTSLANDQDITDVTTTNSAYFNQFVGANTPFQGTNMIALGTNTIWGSNGALVSGMTNQWHFYVVTNNALDPEGSSSDVTNAAFITFDAFELSVPREGVFEEADPTNATRAAADIDMYATTDPGLTNLNPVTISNCLAGVNGSTSLSQGGSEFVFFTNSTHGQVYYIGIMSQDQMASEYDFLPVFTATPFSQLQPNGDEQVNGLLLPAAIPSGTPALPGSTNVFALAIIPMQIEDVIVTNLNQHQNFGDLVGTLSFGGASAVLNNHDGLGNTIDTTIPLVYDGSADPVRGSRTNDGPGNLLAFQGKSALGPWMLNELNNAPGLTGQVSQLTLVIQPHRDLNEPGITVSIPPGGFFIDNVTVGPGFTNLTFVATNLPPTIGPPPLVMYEKFNAEPTVTDFDFAAGLTNTLAGSGTYPGGADPGNSISLGPPLAIGNYFIGVFNPSTSQTASVFIEANLGIDTTANDSFTFTSGGSQPLLGDAVTTSTGPLPNGGPNLIIPVSATNLVESVNVGMVVQTPQIADMTFTLVSPTGQRVLLMENRGGDSTNGAGGFFVFSNILNSTATGNAAANTNFLAVSPNGGVIPITYNFFTIPDEMTIYAGTNPATFNLNSSPLYNSGFISNSPPVFMTTNINYPPGISNVTIIMNEFGNPFDAGGGDAWTYTAGATVTNFEYLTFTDDTNLTDVPIKFAVPPFFFAEVSSNFTLSDFDFASNGLYRALATITDNVTGGGWTVPTNITTITTAFNLTNNQLQTFTNVEVLTNNFVSIVTDPADAVGDGTGSSNFLALAKGTITRSIPTVPGNQYNVTFWYRGPGIASWWRGEGNASDSSDPEVNGNNGALVGLFNFPAGEVDQAFQFINYGNEFEFAGTNAYVQVPQSPSLDVGKGGGFTVEGWINPTNLSQPQPVIEWLAHVPTNTAITNIVIKAGPYYDPATGHYYYMLGTTDWLTSEQWATELGGHLATINTADEQNWIFDNFAKFGGFNHNLWIGLTNNGTDFVWSSGLTNSSNSYVNWLTGQPANANGADYTGMLGETNAQAGLWVLATDNGNIDTNGTTLGGTNKFFGVVEVNQIQTNGVQFWISATNTPGTTNLPFASTNGCLYANLVDTNFVSHEIHSAPLLLQSNVFQHVALTYDTNSGLAILYLDGTNVASTNFGLSTPIVAKTDGDVLLGHDLSPNTNNYFGGLMDEMSVYQRALSPAEILSIYQVSAFTTNRTVGKFDPSVTPAAGLAEALVDFGGTTNVLFGVNDQWQENSFTFTATSNSMPLQITGLEPGILLQDFSVSLAPATNLYYLPEQSLAGLTGTPANGNWSLQVWDNLTGSAVTNLAGTLLSWQLSFVLQSNAEFAATLAPQGPSTNTIPAGQIVYFQVNVPSWAQEATNILVSSTLPVNLLFNPTNLPTGFNPGDLTLLTGSTGGAGTPAIVVNTNAPFAAGQAGTSYILGVQNNNATPVSVVLQVDYNITPLTNGVPNTSSFGTNDTVRYFSYTVGSNAFEATFQLLKLSGNADLVVSKGTPLPTLTNADYGSFNASNFDENIYVFTNSSPVPLSPGTWYIGVIKRDPGVVDYTVLAQELDITNSLTNSVTIINLTNGVPFNGMAGPGAALTNFFVFSVTNPVVSGVTDYVQGVHFELYNLTGNGDLTVETNALPLAPPFFQTSQNTRRNPESIMVFTNGTLTNLAANWYLGVPNNEVSNINYTIVAVIITNSYFPAFPGATGSGGGAEGAGHAGVMSTVYHVTSMDDTGPGTLRDAVSDTNRTVVFDVPGIIFLKSPLIITNSDLTIAGQTAPGVGITVQGQMTTVTNAHDVIIRDVRFRAGIDDGDDQPGGPTSLDSLQFLNVSNAVADHISAEWSSNNLVSVSNSSNVTVQWSILSDSLYTTTNPRPFGSLLRFGNGALSFNHDLYANNYQGSPRLGDNLRLDFVNNVVYNWGTNAGFSSNDMVFNPGGFTNNLNYDCNYLIAGSNSLQKNIAFFGGTPDTWIFQTNNIIDSNDNGILDGADTQWAMFTNQFTKVGQPFPLIPVPTDEAYLAYEKDLDSAGANMSKRDYVDSNIVEQVRNQTGTIIATPPLWGMVGWWRAENNTLDTIGTNNGAWVGTSSYTNGEVDQAFNFNGPPGESWVQVPDAPALHFTNAMTVEAWVKVRSYTAPANDFEIVSKFGGPTPVNEAAAYTFSIDPVLQEAYFIVDYPGTPLGFTTVYGSTTKIPINQWTHLVGTYDGSMLRIYVNGQFSGSATPVTQGINPGNNPLVIGCTLQDNSSPTSFFNGQIDEVSLYNRALSSNEIAAVYNAGASGKFYYYSNSLAKPYLDTDQDGIPDFWENTFGQPPFVPSNNDASTNVNELGYTTLEEYNNWSAGPHALTVTNTAVGVDLNQLFGKTGNLSFFVTNAVNGSVNLTNVIGSVTNTGPYSNSIAYFVPTNTTPAFSGYASFDVYVTNTATVAYFGPVTVSVVVSAVPITTNNDIPPVMRAKVDIWLSACR